MTRTAPSRPSAASAARIGAGSGCSRRARRATRSNPAARRPDGRGTSHWISVGTTPSPGSAPSSGIVMRQRKSPRAIGCIGAERRSGTPPPARSMSVGARDPVDEPRPLGELRLQRESSRSNQRGRGGFAPVGIDRDDFEIEARRRGAAARCACPSRRACRRAAARTPVMLGDVVDARRRASSRRRRGGRASLQRSRRHRGTSSAREVELDPRAVRVEEEDLPDAGADLPPARVLDAVRRRAWRACRRGPSPRTPCGR